MSSMYDGRQPYPSSAAVARAGELQDPRFGCWFCGEPSVALGPHHSGGDENVPAHWLPICEHHRDHWHDEVDAGERLPIIPLIALDKLESEDQTPDDLSDTRYDT